MQAGWRLLELAGEVRVDLQRRVVEHPDGRRERLTALEAAVLGYLAQRDAVVGREELLEKVWGYAPNVVSRACDNTVRRLRTKLEVDPAAPELLLTVHGGGYTLALASGAPTPGPAPSETSGRRLALGDRVIDFGKGRIERANGPHVQLTSTELGVLTALADANGESVERGGLQRRVWGSSAGRPLVSTIGRIRRKLEDNPDRPGFLVTTATGYRLELGAPAGAAAAAAPWQEGFAAGTHPEGLPAHIDARFGRDSELALVLARFDAGDRLVTLAGMGGIGKTRLAADIARRVASSGRRALWVDLADVRTVERMIDAVAGALRLPAAPGDPLGRVLAALGAAGPVVVVLDNLEQLLPDAAVAVTRIAEGAPHARLLVTSRIALGVRGERRIDLGPLSGEDAVALFFDRAVRPPPAEDRPVVAALVRALDGLPLAIELAAARTSVFGAGELLTRTHDRLRMLASADPSRPGRHQSLRASIDASWALLSGPARRGLGLLTVFAGSARIDEIEQVIGSRGGVWAVDVVQELVDAGLVRLDGDSGRFSLPEVLRAYAAASLSSDARAAAEIRHGVAYARFGGADQLARQLGPDEIALQGALVAELDNLWIAAERALDRRDGWVALRVAEAAWQVHRLVGAYAVAGTWARRLCACAFTGRPDAVIDPDDPGDADPDTATDAGAELTDARPDAPRGGAGDLAADDWVRAQFVASRFEEGAGQMRVAEALVDGAATAVDRVDPQLAARILAMQATYHTMHERYGPARTTAEAALALAQRIGDGGTESWALVTLCRNERYAGHLDDAYPYARAGLEAAARSGSIGRRVEALRELAALPGPAHARDALLSEALSLARDRGDLVQAADVGCELAYVEHNRYRADSVGALEGYLRLFQRVGDRYREGAGQMYVAVARIAALDGPGADAALSAAHDIAVAIGSANLRDAVRWRRGQAWLLLGDAEHARAVLDEALGDGPTGSVRGGIRLWLALACDALGDRAAARTQLDRVAAGTDAGPWAVAEALDLLGALASDGGDLGTAEVLYRNALELGEDNGFGHVVCRALAHLSGVCAAQGGWDEAQRLLARGAARAAAMGDPAWPALDLGLAAGELALRAGDRGRAAEALDRIARIQRPGGSPGILSLPPRERRRRDALAKAVR